MNISLKTKKIIYYLLSAIFFIYLIGIFAISDDFFDQYFYILLIISLLFFLVLMTVYVLWGKEIEGDKYASNTTVRLWILLAFVCMTATALIMAY